MNKIMHIPAPSASLDVDVLRSFIAIVEGGSIAAAADRVGRTAGAVSMQVKKLEDMLGRSLFERTRQGMLLTAEGDRLLDYARRMVELNREAMQAFSEPELDGTVSVGIVDSFKGERLAEVLGNFACCYSKATVNVAMSNTVNLVPDLDAGKYDVIMMTPGGAHAQRDGDIVVHEEPLVWIAREGGRAMRARPVPISVADNGCAWRKLAMDSLAGADVATRVAYISDHDSGQLAAVQADLAVAPMPRSYLQPGMVELGKRDGYPKLGNARLVMRISEGASGTARALAARIAESYGKRIDIAN
ncbi:MAG: LysR family transcriptional regulator [Pseudomonadota bacterium]